MKKYVTYGDLNIDDPETCLPGERREIYLASDVDAHIAELEKALRDVMEWVRMAGD